MSDKNAAIIPFVSSDAPVVYFDGAPNFGFANDIANVTLEQVRFADDNKGGVSAERVACVHLRMNLLAVQALQSALNNIMLMAQKTEGPAN